MTILAFDYGSKRIGVAIKRAEDNPEPLQTLSNDTNLANTLKQLLEQLEPAKLIVGRPRNLEGESTPQTQEAEAFAQTLRDTYNKEVILQDEALTSEEANNRISTKTKPHERKSQLDQYAALIILEDYLREV